MMPPDSSETLGETLEARENSNEVGAVGATLLNRAKSNFQTQQQT